jgi:hypothetical protein
VPDRPDPERILAEIDERRARTAEAEVRDKAEHARCNRLYEASHRVEVYDTQRYEEEQGRRPADDTEFCRGWTADIITLARVLDDDGWWEQVEQVLSGDPQTEYLLAILTAARDGDPDRTAWLLEQACQRGSAMYEAAVWLRGRLRDELRGLGRYRVAPPATQQPATSQPDGEPEAGTADEPEGVDGGPPGAGMTWQEVAERMERLRTQGEPFTSQHKLAKQLGCSSGTINKAIRETPSLKPWAERKAAAPRAQSLDPVVTDRAAQGRELDPADDAAIREFIEKADPQVKAWFLALPVEEQLEVVNDPDKHRKILGRKP